MSARLSPPGQYRLQMQGTFTSHCFSYDDFRVLAWQNYWRRLRGEECVISTMQDTWVGYWVRDLNCSIVEHFLYSKSDFYIPYK